MAEERTRRKVIIPVDGSEHSVRAFNWYCKNIHRNGDLILIVHINELPAMPVMYYPFNVTFREEWLTKVDESKREARELVERFGLRCQQNKFKFKILMPETKIKPGKGICKLAKDERANLVVMANRGQNALRRTFLGRVSDYVVHHVHIPVAIVPPPKPSH